jgi:hypothetical protein
MVDSQEDIRWLRTKLEEAKDDTERGYILKQLELLEAKELAESQVLLAE